MYIKVHVTADACPKHLWLNLVDKEFIISTLMFFFHILTSGFVHSVPLHVSAGPFFKLISAVYY